MKHIRKKPKKMEKLNLIPILDSVFIFIFFLLMSAQFLEIYEIGSDAPSVKTTDSIKDDKPPLNLTLEVSEDSITVITGLPEKVYKKIDSIGGAYDLQKLEETLAEIKQNNIDEKSVILRPQGSVSYKKIIKIMDTARQLKGDKTLVIQRNGRREKTKTLFEQIIFETII